METTALDGLTLRCAACGRSHKLGELAWRCADCGGVLDLAGFTPALPPLSVIGQRRPTLWRYAEALPIDEPADISLGEGMTPLVTAPDDPGVPAQGRLPDAERVVQGPGRGAAGGARPAAGRTPDGGGQQRERGQRGRRLRCPGRNSVRRGRPGRHLGGQGRAVARVRRHRPPDPLPLREDTAAAAAEAADRPGTFYASHVYHPFFLQGMKTYVFELWSSSAAEEAPSTRVPLPTGSTRVAGSRPSSCLHSSKDVGLHALQEERVVDVAGVEGPRLVGGLRPRRRRCPPWSRGSGGRWRRTRANCATLPAEVAAGTYTSHGIPARAA